MITKLLFQFLFPLAWATAQYCADPYTQDESKVDLNPNARFCGLLDSWVHTERNYTVISNVWNPSKDGGQCLEIYNGGEGFAINWKWPTDKSSVHSYPHVKFHSGFLPIELERLEALYFSAAWSTHMARQKMRFRAFDRNNHNRTDSKNDYPADGPKEEDDYTMANVAIDMFLDQDRSKAVGETTASHEILIWPSSYGGPYPIGWRKEPVPVQIQGHDFLLYQGLNHRKTNAFTFIANSNNEYLKLDLTMFIRHLRDQSLLPSELFLGLVQFGQETYRSSENVTFCASNYGLAVVRQTGDRHELSYVGTVGAQNEIFSAGQSPEESEGSPLTEESRATSTLVSFAILTMALAAAFIGATR